MPGIHEYVMTKQILYEIAGTKYVLIELTVFPGEGKKVDKLIKDYSCVLQGISQIHRGIFTKSFVVLNILVPENNVFEFQKNHLA